MVSSNELKIWASDGSGGATPLEITHQMETEGLLEETLVNNPDMLMPGLTLVGRQTRTEGGPLDLLGVDRDGRLVLFELKRGSLNRDAVAQVLDYGSWLETLDDEALAQHIANSSGHRGIDNIEDFAEWYGGRWSTQELSELRPMRLFLVGLGVNDTTVRMVQFLANGGIDISLLTFLGFRHGDETLLARQVQVKVPEEPENISQPHRRRRSRRGSRELLEQRIDEHTAEWPEARALWDAILQMFRENCPGVEEIASGGESDWSRHRLNLRFPGVRWVSAAIQLGPFDNHPKLVMPIFYRDTVNSCLPEFVQIRRELSPYWTYPSHRRDVEARDVEVGFPVNSIDEWEERKDKVAALTRSVYEAHNATKEE